MDSHLANDVESGISCDKIALKAIGFEKLRRKAISFHLVDSGCNKRSGLSLTAIK